jgi:aryl-alcohol dehydrogenase-like predicted oxidoreductase
MVGAERAAQSGVMERRTLGRTGMDVSVLGFGGAEIGYENASDNEVDRIVGAALDNGVNVFDTAECYVDSEEKLGRVLAGRRHSVFLFSKCGHAAGLAGADWDPAMLERSIDRSLQLLRTDTVDLMQLHSCSRDVLAAGGVIEILQRARDAGKVRFIGYSGDAYDALYAIQTGAFDTLQTSVNIADQEAVELTIPEAVRRGMGVIAKRAIANAAWKAGQLPGNPYHHTYWRRLTELQYEFLRGPVQESVSIALRFTLAVPGIGMAIVGTKNADRWAENVRMLHDGALPPGLFDKIRQRWSHVARPDWIGQV